MTITLSKGGSAERQIELSKIVIPDLWHIAQALPEPHKSMILDCWHLAYDLHRTLEEVEPEINKMPLLG